MVSLSTVYTALALTFVVIIAIVMFFVYSKSVKRKNILKRSEKMSDLDQKVAERWIEMLDVFQGYQEKIAKSYLKVKDDIGKTDLEMAVAEAPDARYFPDAVGRLAPRESYVGKVIGYIVRCNVRQVLFLFDGEKDSNTGPLTSVVVVNSDGKQTEEKLPGELTDEYIELCIRKVAGTDINH